MCPRAYQNSFIQHILTADLLCTRHHSREHAMQMYGVGTSQRRKAQGELPLDFMEEHSGSQGAEEE